MTPEAKELVERLRAEKIEKLRKWLADWPSWKFTEHQEAWLRELFAELDARASTITQQDALIEELERERDARRAALVQLLFGSEVSRLEPDEELISAIAKIVELCGQRAIAAEARVAELEGRPDENGFVIGHPVEKFTGEARWEGTLVASYLTTKGKRRYVVEVHPQGFQMIAVPAQMRMIAALTDDEDGAALAHKGEGR